MPTSVKLATFYIRLVSTPEGQTSEFASKEKFF